MSMRVKKYSTVLILGAGASKPYGFPDGTELLEQIKGSLVQGHPFRNKLLEEKYLASDLKELLLSLNDTQSDTIDEFLGAPACKNSAIYTKIVKYAIAHTLLEQEKSVQLQSPNDWYKKLYVRIFGLLEDEPTDDTAIITFNYDRSLEEYLCRTHAAKQGMDANEARKSILIRRIPIVHVHGKLSSSGYGGSDDFKTIVKASHGIIINTDKTAQDFKKIEKANALIRNARLVYILGFGYHDENMKKIGLHKQNSGQRITGTVLNMTDPQRNHIREVIRGIRLVQDPIDQFLLNEWI